MTTILHTARAAHGAGLCVLPTCADGSKRPDVPSWLRFKTARPTAEEMRAFDFAHRAGLGILGGAVSGGLDPWDIDDAEAYLAFVEAADACVLGDVLRRIRAGFEVETPGGGRRWLVRYPPDLPFADVVLARRPGREGEPRIKTLIELTTFSIVAPSNGRTHPSGRPYVQLAGSVQTIAHYTEHEREGLLALARSFDQMPRPEAGRPAATRDVNGDRPGDDYGRRVSWPEILQPAGWTHVYDRGEVSYWRRPGKSHGISASTNVGGSGLLYPFSSSTEFAPDKSYSKFGAYAALEHGGNYRAAAQALADLGYGRHDEAPAAPAAPRLAPAIPCTLADVDTTFRRWLGQEYDLEAMHAVVAAAAAEQLPGDPLWLLIVSGSGAAKTETAQALAGGGAIVTSTISSDGALLSASPRRERAKDSTGGL